MSPLFPTNQERYTEETLFLSGEKQAVRTDLEGFWLRRKGNSGNSSNQQTLH